MYSKTLFVLLLVFFVSNFSNGQRNKKFFRKDYKYIKATESFYKFHTLPKTWRDAKRTCEQEGARLFYPEDDAEAQTAMDYWTATQPQIGWLFVGISDLVAKGVYETIDGFPIGDVYHNWGLSQPDNTNNNEDCVVFRKDTTFNDYDCLAPHPFICKKTLVSLEWNNECDMPNLDYKINGQLGKCYKFHLKPLNWTDAHAVCSNEGSYLAVINSQYEADYLAELTEKAPKDNVTGDMAGVVHLGFHDRFHEGWQVIRGTTLENSGYTTWGNGQPDGPPRGVDERCGSMFYNGHLNDVRCDRISFFICEHDLRQIPSDRFGD